MNSVRDWEVFLLELPRNVCPKCGKLLFIGFAENIEIKCRRCKSICRFTKDDWTKTKKTNSV